MLSFGLGAVLLVSCASNGLAGPDDIEHGPFDSNGNYIEAWANGRPKSSRKKSKKKSVAKAKPKKKGPTIARAKKNQKPEWLKKSADTKPAPKVAAKSKPKSTPKVRSTPKAKPKPKSVMVKPKVKPPRRHVVASGDTLYNISRRYGSSVTSIQKANKISGTNIRLGQVLMVPVR